MGKVESVTVGGNTLSDMGVSALGWMHLLHDDWVKPILVSKRTHPPGLRRTVPTEELHGASQHIPDSTCYLVFSFL